MGTTLNEACVSDQTSKRWQSAVLLGCLILAVLAIVFGVKPATIGFHRLMVHGLHAAFIELDGTPIPEGALHRLKDDAVHRLWHEADWHQRRLVSLGCLQRRVHKFHYLPRQSPARKGLLSDLSKAMDRDCTFAMGPNQIEMIAPPQTIERLMAIVQAHGVAVVGDR